MAIVALKMMEFQLVLDELIVGELRDRTLHCTYGVGSVRRSNFPEALLVLDKDRGARKEG